MITPRTWIRATPNRHFLVKLWAMMLLAAPIGAANYVGSAACKNCHPQIYQKITNSIHSKMIRKISADGTIPTNQPSMTPTVSHIHGNLNAPKAPPLSEVTYVMGGWYKEESYIKESVDTAGKPVFSVTKYEWDPIKGTYRDDRDGTRNWLTQCAGCHTTGYEPSTQTFAEVNIGCEKCHGPGGDHATSDGDKSLIVKDTSSEGCGFCHIRAQNVAMGSFTNKQFNFPIGYELGKPETLKFLPQALSDTNSFFPNTHSKRHRQQFLDMNYPGARVSKHYQKNVTCTHCHDPHTSGIVTVLAQVPTEANAPTNGIYGIKIYDNAASATNFAKWDGEGLKSGFACSTCHSTVEPTHVHYFTAKSLAASITCTDCHMPDLINVDGATLRGALHIHTFQSIRPEISKKFTPDLQPNSCTYRCHQDKGATKTERATWAATYLQSHLQLVSLAAPGATLRLHGLKDFSYTIEGSSDLLNWTALSTNKADANGVLNFQDGTGASALKFYRAQEK